MKPLQAIPISKAGFSVTPSFERDQACGRGKVVIGRNGCDDEAVDLLRAQSGVHECGARRRRCQVAGRLCFSGPVPPLHSRSRRDPLVGGLQPGFQIVIADDSRRRIMTDARRSLRQRRARTLTGRLFLYLADLAPLIRAAVRTREVRPLGLMALRAKHRRDVAELPVGSAAAARLAAGRLPF